MYLLMELYIYNTSIIQWLKDVFVGSEDNFHIVLNFLKWYIYIYIYTIININFLLSGVE